MKACLGPGDVVGKVDDSVLALCLVVRGGQGTRGNWPLCSQLYRALVGGCEVCVVQLELLGLLDDVATVLLLLGLV